MAGHGDYIVWYVRQGQRFGCSMRAESALRALGRFNRECGELGEAVAVQRLRGKGGVLPIGELGGLAPADAGPGLAPVPG